MIELNELSKKLFGYKSVALFCHVRPDGDTIGSAIGLKYALIKKGIKAEVFCEEQISDTFFYLTGAREIKRELDGEYQAYVAIDSADISRLGIFAEMFLTQKNTISIDHHISNTRFAKDNYVVDNAANAENIFDIITAQNVEIDSVIANALATGIVTDTGNFRHKNLTANTFRVASELVKYGADLNKIVYCNFIAQSKERAKLFAITMNKLRYYLEDKLCVAIVTLEDINKANASKDETEGFIDFVMGIECVEVGICILEIEKDKFKISFRSKNANVNEIAGVFGGGGHILASGCRICGELEEVVDKLVSTVKRYLPE